MFSLITTKVAADLEDAVVQISNFIVESGGTLLNDANGTYTMVTKDGKYISMSKQSPSVYEVLRVKFGKGVDADNTLILIDEPNYVDYFELHDDDNYLKNIDIDCYRQDSDHQTFVFRLVCVDAPNEPLFLVFGSFENNLNTGKTAFFMSGNYELRQTVFPAISTSTYDYAARGIVHLELGSSSTQLYEQYTTQAQATDQCVLFPTCISGLRSVSSTPSAGIPLQPWMLYVKDPTGEIYLAGIVEGLYFASNELPDGAIITKGTRNFRVCRSLSDVNYGSFLIELASAE